MLGASPNSFEAVASKWRKLHCEARKLRSLSAIDRFLKRMTQAWDGRDFASIGRGDVAKLLDTIELENGERQATYALQVFRSLANWYACRDDHYRSPIVKGMARGDATRRERILSDDELRAVWKRAEADGDAYGAFIRLALLTAQRREKIGGMMWSDLDAGVWTIATEAREKNNAGALVLPPVALAILEALPRVDGNPFVFAGRGGKHIAGWSRFKHAFDAKVKIAPWTVHDLRRTARSLMSRAGIRPDIPERVMGHAIKGVEGTYDRHSYEQEKADALQRLAQQIMDVVVPPPPNVVRLQAGYPYS